MKFVLYLNKVHREMFSDRTAYQISQATGLSQTTVRRYVYEDPVHLTRVDINVVLLCDHFGVNWRDPKILDVIEDEEDIGSESEDDAETETPPVFRLEPELAG